MQRHNHPQSKKLKRASINLVPTPQGTFYRVSIFAKGAEIQVGENWLMNGQDFTQGAGMTMVYPVRATGGFKFMAGQSGTVELTTDPLPVVEAEELASKNRIPGGILLVIAIIVGLSLLWLIGQMDAPAAQSPVVSSTPYLPMVIETEGDQAAVSVVQKPAEQPEQPVALPTEEPADAPSPTPLPTPTAAATPIYTPTWHSSADLLRLDAIPDYLQKYEESLKACVGKGGKYGLVVVGGWNSARIRVANSNVPFEGTTCTASTVAYYHQSNAADVSYEGKFLIINHNFDDITVDGIPLHPRNDGVYDLIVRYFE